MTFACVLNIVEIVNRKGCHVYIKFFSTSFPISPRTDHRRYSNSKCRADRGLYVDHDNSLYSAPRFASAELVLEHICLSLLFLARNTKSS